MKLAERERVEHTRVSIGRRVLRRTDARGNVYERVSGVYWAVYTDTNRKQQAVSLGTPNRREARRLAVKLQVQLDEGGEPRRQPRLEIETLIERYLAFCEAKGLAAKTLAKYRSDLSKLAEFCAQHGVVLVSALDEEMFHRFGAWLRERQHKQKRAYAGKTIYTALTIAKQMTKWAKRQKLIAEDPIEAAQVPVAKARDQFCPTTAQVEALASACERKDGWETEHAAILILAYTGMRVGELVALRWSDVEFGRGELGMLRVRRGGSGDGPKDRDERFVPIHPRVRPLLDGLRRADERVLPELRDRTLLARLKRLARETGVSSQIKTHSLRHHFASMVANSGVPYRMALAWMGHSSSSILDLYYHLHDAEADAAMRRLAASAAHAASR